MEHPIVTIVEQGIIRSINDFVRLNIVDWERFSPYWKSEQNAIDVISRSFVNRFYCTIAKVDLLQYPERNDFPGWSHVGDHVSIGKLFWNHFKYCFDGRLVFHDSPDFSGYFYNRKPTPRKHHFRGDIGKVSPIAMKEAATILGPYSMWISVIDEHTQIILEKLIPIDPNMDLMITREEGLIYDVLVPNRSTRKRRKNITQPSLF